MWFKLKCTKCGEILSGKKCYDVDPLNGTSISRSWYSDQTGLNHTAIACLCCGTIHDTTPSLIKLLIGRPFTVHGTINPKNETFLDGYTGKLPEAYKKVQLKHMGISKDIVEAFVSRSIIGVDNSS